MNRRGFRSMHCLGTFVATTNSRGKGHLFGEELFFMICKFCREDLPASNFRLEDYHRAKTNLRFPTCVACLKRPIGSKKEKKRVVKEIMRKVHAPDRKQIWKYCDDEQKAQLQFAGRTRHEMKLHAALEVAGINFEPQCRVGPYWVDFGFRDRRLAVEVDGSIHDTPEVAKNDSKRQRDIEERYGWKVVRFTNAAIDADCGAVLEEINRHIAERWEFSKLASAISSSPNLRVVYVPPPKAAPSTPEVLI
jgi:very-short-patch-repair endonuclease